MGDEGGKVYLVGAGPGAADLVTLRAAELVRTAHVIVYDHLANQDLLSTVAATTELIRAVGGSGTMARDELVRTLVEKARSGKSVVRLFDGDPFFADSAANEASALAAAGIDFELVPGLSLASAAPSFAGIPLACSDHVSPVTFVNLDREAASSAKFSSWKELADITRGGGTLVLSIGTDSMRESLERLIASGMPPDSPACAIFDATMAAQKVVAATVTTLSAEVERSRLNATAIIVIGDRAAVQPQLRWFERRPLFGRRIVVTRGSANAAALTAPLRAHGAEVIECPTIETGPPDSYAALDAALGNLGSFDWVIFTSATGVDNFFTRMAARGGDIRELASARIAAIGPATAARLKSHALKIAVQPSEYRAEAIAHAIGESRIRGARFLIPRAQVARETLPEMLATQGAATVEVVPCYKTVMPKGVRVERLRGLVDAGAIDLVTFTSSSTATNFCAIVGAVPPALKAGAIGPITAETARTLGFEVVVSPSEYTIDSLVGAIVEYFAAKRKN
ncbi:MAG TPA: uroporphyrinogen-III synthase [Candidatus Binataceae bacterium]|nr:uroporphyrinogen-III synthase [Candidatus Binataceae bacterium]